MNKRGFTLVELLAVIVLLSILLLLALPNVFNIIKSSKEKSFRNEALEFIKAAETQYAEENKTGCVVYYYQVDNDGKFYDVGGWSKQDDDSFYTHQGTNTKFYHLNNMKHKKGYTVFIKVDDKNESTAIISQCGEKGCYYLYNSENGKGFTKDNLLISNISIRNQYAGSYNNRNGQYYDSKWILCSNN